jgi:hypothetical protein
MPASLGQPSCSQLRDESPPYLLMDCKKPRANALVDSRIWLKPHSGPDLITRF